MATLSRGQKLLEMFRLLKSKELREFVRDMIQAVCVYKWAKID